MKRYIALIAAVVLVSVAISGIALAGATRLTLNPYPPAAPIEPGASGKAIINCPKGDVVLQITVSAKGLTPNTAYTVYMGKPWTPVGTLNTNSNGNGAFHRNFRKDETPPATAKVALNNPAGSSVLMN